jgi:uncharacterized damage-inducible protein DinB
MARAALDVCPLEGREPQIGFLLAAIDDNTDHWRRELGRVAVDAVVWQPVENGHSIGALMLHMADVEAFWLHEVAAGAPIPESDQKLFLSKETEQYKGIWPRPPRQPLSWYFDQQDRIRARTHQLLASQNDPAQPCRYRTREFTLRWLVEHVITHEAYHAGQAVLLASLHAKQSVTPERPSAGSSEPGNPR